MLRRQTFVLLLAIKWISAARILVVVPTSSFSHYLSLRPFTLELARHNEVVIWTANPAYEVGKSPSNITEIGFFEESYTQSFRNVLLNELSRTSPVEFTYLIFKHMYYVFKRQFTSKQGQGFVNSLQHFDLIIAEACAPMALTMSHIFKAPAIQISSFTGDYVNFNYMAAPTHPLLYPQVFRQRINNLNLFDKFHAYYEDYFIQSYRRLTSDLEIETLEELFGSDAPSISEFEERVGSLILNVNPAWDGNRPVPRNIIYAGGLNQVAGKPLPNDLKTYLDASANGVIFISFGTNVDPSRLHPSTLKVFFNVFSRLPYDVLLKSNGELTGRPSNVRTEKWLPQADLLKHPKVKLFITQGGLQSTNEAIEAAVPLIAFPILGDQFYNAEKYEHFGIGLKMDLKTVTEELLEYALNKVLRDNRYQENIARLGAQMRDQPQNPLKLAVWWTEYAMRHPGANHLRATRASWSEWLLLDVIFMLVGIAVAVIFVIVFATKRLIRLFVHGKYKSN